jgi:hypothetical protein
VTAQQKLRTLGKPENHTEAKAKAEEAKAGARRNGKARRGGYADGDIKLPSRSTQDHLPAQCKHSFNPQTHTPIKLISVQCHSTCIAAMLRHQNPASRNPSNH